MKEKFGSLIQFSHTMLMVFSILLLGCTEGIPEFKKIFDFNDDASNPFQVSVEQADSQPDPTLAGTMQFTITFTQEVNTTTFDASDITLDGTAISHIDSLVSSADFEVFTLTVNTTSDGTVIPSVAKGVVTSTEGLFNAASNSSDNSVTQDTMGPIVIVGAPSPMVGGGGSVFDFPVTINEPINAPLTATNVVTVPLGVSCPTVTVSNGHSQNPIIHVSGCTGSGTISVNIPAGQVFDLLNQPNTIFAGNSPSATVDNTMMFWTGATSSSWSVASNWSSGIVPGSTDKAIFDSGCSICSVSIDGTVDVQLIHLKSDYSGTLTQGPGSNIQTGKFFIDGGTFMGGSSNIVVTDSFGSSFVQTGGTFTSTSTELQIAGGNFEKSGGTFNHNSGTVNFNGASSQAFANIAGTTNFKNLTLTNSLNLDVPVQISGNLNLNGSSGTLNGQELSVGGSINTTMWLGGDGKIVVTGSSASLSVVTGNLPSLVVGSGNTLTLSGASTVFVDGSSGLEVESGATLEMQSDLTVANTLNVGTGAYVNKNCKTLTAAVNGLGTVRDHPTPTLSVNDPTGDNEPGTVTFRVTSAPTVCSTVTFDYSTANGTALAGIDFNAAGNVAQPIPPALGYTDITVTTLIDTAVEGDETFNLNISNPTGATIGDSSGTGTIPDNPPPVITGATCFRTAYLNQPYLCYPKADGEADLGETPTWNIEPSSTCLGFNIAPPTGQITGTPTTLPGECFLDVTVSEVTHGSSPIWRIPINKVDPAMGTSSLSAFADHSCANRDGVLNCWGDGADKKLGTGSTTDEPAPETVLDNGSGNLAIPLAVSAGLSSSCAINTATEVMCWGSRWKGQIGDNSGTSGTSPFADTKVWHEDEGSTLIGAKAIANGGDFSCALIHSATAALNGRVACWGKNNYGQLGDGTNTDRNAAVWVNHAAASYLTGAIQISAGHDHACALMDDGTVHCWGRNDFGQLGINNTSDKNTATLVSNIGPSSGDRIFDIALGHTHTCALDEAGAMKCWGDNSFGKLGIKLSTTSHQGDGASEMALLPNIDVGSGGLVFSISAGEHTTCAQIGSSQLKCWGEGSSGALGQENTSDIGFGTAQMGDSLSSIDLGSPSPPVKAIAGSDFTCSILMDSSVKCWGNNSKGQLGIGTTGSNIGDNAGEMGVSLGNVNFP